ncbi:MAG: hypothetical protein WA799_07395 [Nitrosotalea sp.]
MSQPEFNSRKHEQYRTINVNGVFGGIRMGYVEIVTYSEEADLTKAMSSAQINPNKAEIDRVLECRLIMDPIQMKSVSLWLAKNVEEYEKLFGRIPSPEEIANKQKLDKGQ